MGNKFIIVVFFFSNIQHNLSRDSYVKQIGDLSSDGIYNVISWKTLFITHKAQAK